MLPLMTIEQITHDMDNAATYADSQRLRATLATLKVRELRALAAMHRVPVGSKDKRDVIADRIAWICFGARMSSMALERNSRA